jgi:small GTP-binding protein
MASSNILENSNSIGNNNNNNNELLIKILLLGESGVGKTSILLNYTENKFSKSYLPTIGIDYKTKILDINNHNIKIKIWDTAGQEKFRNLTSQYFRNSNGIFIIFDLSDKLTFDRINDWMKQINYYLYSIDVPIVLLGNKCDNKNREVNEKIIDDLSNFYSFKYFNVSALKNIGINEAFNYMINEILKKNNIKDIVIDKNYKSFNLDKNKHKKNEKKKKKNCIC